MQASERRAKEDSEARQLRLLVMRDNNRARTDTETDDERQQRLSTG